MLSPCYNFTRLFPHKLDSSFTLSDKFKVNEIDYGSEQQNGGWWIEIFTAQPACIYHYGDFETIEIARAALPQFVQNLLNSGSSGLSIRIQLYSPMEWMSDHSQVERRINPISHFPVGVDII